MLGTPIPITFVEFENRVVPTSMTNRFIDYSSAINFELVVFIREV
jgi:hypothetical protein